MLRDDGVIFISIDDGEVHNLRKICDEIFGEENFEGHIHWRRRHNQPNDRTKMIGLVAEHIIVYAKSSETLRASGVGKIDLTGDFSNPDNDPRGDWASKPWKVGSDQSGSRYAITTPNGVVLDEDWMGEESTYKALLADNRILFPRGGDGMPRKKYFRCEREEEGQCATNWWEHSQFGHNQGANDCMTELFGIKNVFSNPKPVELLRGLVQITNTKKDDIVLDFFSGSATTAHAVMQLNFERDSHLRFILVQLPENLDKNYEASSGKTKAQLQVAIDFLSSVGKPHYISEIGKERIRRAGQKIKDEAGLTACNLDTGFRVFKLDSSNLKIWDDSPVSGENAAETFEQRLWDYLDVLVPDRTDTDLVYEIMLKLGQDLCQPIISIDLDSERRVYGVGSANTSGTEIKFIVCLAKNITPEDAVTMADYAPGRIVFAEQCFGDSTDKSNVRLTLKDKGIAIKTL